MTYGDFVEAKMNKEYDLDNFDMKIIETDPSYIQYKLKIVQWTTTISSSVIIKHSLQYNKYWNEIIKMNKI